MPDTGSSPLLSAAEAGDRANVSDAYVRTVAFDKDRESPPESAFQTKTGKPKPLLGGVKVGNSWKFTLEDVDQWIDVRQACGLCGTLPIAAGGIPRKQSSSPKRPGDQLSAEIGEINGKLQRMSERLRFIEARLDTADVSADPVGRVGEVPPQNPRRAAEAARGQAMSHIFEALRCMALADEQRAIEISELEGELKNKASS